MEIMHLEANIMVREQECMMTSSSLAVGGLGQQVKPFLIKLLQELHEMFYDMALLVEEQASAVWNI